MSLRYGDVLVTRGAALITGRSEVHSAIEESQRQYRALARDNNSNVPFH